MHGRGAPLIAALALWALAALGVEGLLARLVRGAGEAAPDLLAPALALWALRARPRDTAWAGAILGLSRDFYAGDRLGVWTLAGLAAAQGAVSAALSLDRHGPWRRIGALLAAAVAFQAPALALAAVEVPEAAVELALRAASGLGWTLPAGLALLVLMESLPGLAPRP
ncbi:MAG: hypothetical protein HY722_13705 [Planctomycetes bacterium]|nr:hypothetical protein [Planctomycetota bacterium]